MTGSAATGMVVAPQPEAVEAGALVLRDGGNAVDAAITCALVQGVVDPQMTGIAGFGSLHLYLRDQDVHKVIDFHGRAPARARPEMWADRIEGEARFGYHEFRAALAETEIFLHSHKRVASIADLKGMKIRTTGA